MAAYYAHRHKAYQALLGHIHQHIAFMYTVRQQMVEKQQQQTSSPKQHPGDATEQVALGMPSVDLARCPRQVEYLVWQPSVATITNEAKKRIAAHLRSVPFWDLQKRPTTAPERTDCSTCEHPSAPSDQGEA